MQSSADAARTFGNRTGQQASPFSAEMNDIVQPVSAQAADTSALTEVRLQYIREAEPLGSIKSAAAQLDGGIAPFIDKLAERLAYERGGTRLYDAVIAKFIAHEGELEDASLQEVTEIRNEEASHAALLRTCIEQLGADPT